MANRRYKFETVRIVSSIMGSIYGNTGNINVAKLQKFSPNYLVLFTFKTELGFSWKKKNLSSTIFIYFKRRENRVFNQILCYLDSTVHDVVGNWKKIFFTLLHFSLFIHPLYFFPSTVQESGHHKYSPFCCVHI